MARRDIQSTKDVKYYFVGVQLSSVMYERKWLIAVESAEYKPILFFPHGDQPERIHNLTWIKDDYPTFSDLSNSEKILLEPIEEIDLFAELL